MLILETFYLAAENLEDALAFTILKHGCIEQGKLLIDLVTVLFYLPELLLVLHILFLQRLQQLLHHVVYFCFEGEI